MSMTGTVFGELDGVWSEKGIQKLWIFAIFWKIRYLQKKVAHLKVSVVKKVHIWQYLIHKYEFIFVNFADFWWNNYSIYAKEPQT